MTLCTLFGWKILQLTLARLHRWFPHYFVSPSQNITARAIFNNVTTLQLTEVPNWQPLSCFGWHGRAHTHNSSPLKSQTASFCNTKSERDPAADIWNQSWSGQHCLRNAETDWFTRITGMALKIILSGLCMECLHVHQCYTVHNIPYDFKLKGLCYVFSDLSTDYFSIFTFLLGRDPIVAPSAIFVQCPLSAKLAGSLWPTVCEF
jgi:hypothetical protein